MTIEELRELEHIANRIYVLEKSYNGIDSMEETLEKFKKEAVEGVEERMFELGVIGFDTRVTFSGKEIIEKLEKDIQKAKEERDQVKKELESYRLIKD